MQIFVYFIVMQIACQLLIKLYSLFVIKVFTTYIILSFFLIKEKIIGMCIFFLHFKRQYLWHKEYIETYLNQPNQQLRSSYLRLPSQRKNPNKFDSPSRIKLVRIFLQLKYFCFSFYQLFRKSFCP